MYRNVFVIIIIIFLTDYLKKGPEVSDAFEVGSTKDRWRCKTNYLKDRVEQPAFSWSTIYKSLMMVSNLKRVSTVLK